MGLTDPTLVQINLQPHFGGGEVYTAFLCRALSKLGIQTRLIVHPRADYWDRLGLPHDTERFAALSENDLPNLIPSAPVWILSHGPLPTNLRKKKSGHLLSAVAHMPVQGRNPDAFAQHDLIFAVSGWVRDGLLAAKLPTWPEPLYGVADLSARQTGETVLRQSRYDWDLRKGRDRLLGLMEPFIESIRRHQQYVRHKGLTLGIVSRLTPIKQFPLLFEYLAPVLATHPDVRLEIFGSGGYASVRDLNAALRPCAQQVRFWGQQSNVGEVFRQIDYLLAGLPEKEALGLNIIEAQACGTPVLAVNAPPFVETVVDRASGFLYRDPREDQGVDFAYVLEQIKTQPRPDPRLAVEHLARFSFDAFVERLIPVVAEVQARIKSR